jgi:GcrA cell cycle regulator
MSNAHPDARKDLIRKLWTDGLSASQIAGEIGDGMTRSAVLGIIHRLGIQRGGKVVDRPRPIERRTPVPKAAAPPKSVASPLPAPIRPAFEADPGPAHNGTGVHLQDLRTGDCRWPLWPHQGPCTSMFCGVPAVGNTPYCGPHARMSYPNLEDRARARVAAERLGISPKVLAA